MTTAIRRNLLAFFSTVFIFTLVPVKYAAAQQMSFRVEEGISNRPIAWIVADGLITNETPRKLEALLKAQTDTPISNIELNSRGGNLSAALEMGRIIRRYRLVTTIPVDAYCLSACAYAFLGGIARGLQSNWGEEPEEAQKRLGFHGFALDMQVPGSLRGADAEQFAGTVAQGSQVTAGALADYVSAMGVNVEIVGRAARYGPKAFLFPPVSELKKLGVLTDYEKDLGEFRLVPDANGIQATFIHEDHQFTVVCSTLFGGRLRPVLVFSQTFGKALDAPIVPIVEPLKMSQILRSTRRPWVPRDLEHKHFHAHSWILGTDWNPVFGFLKMTVGEANSTLAPLSAENSAFFSEGQRFHAVILLQPIVARELLRADSIHFALIEHEHGGGWGHIFTNDARDREVLAYVLRGCPA